MGNAISKEYNFKKLCNYALPTIAMFLFMAFYTIIDALFVAIWVGDDGIAAINIVYPVFQLFSAVGMLFGTGGSALLAKKIGEGKQDEVHSNFTMLCLVGVLIGLIINFIVGWNMDYFLKILGDSRQLHPYTKPYLYWVNVAGIIIILKNITSSMLIAAGQPKLGFMSSIIGGVLNIVLDYIFIVPCGLGISGAALGTLTAMVISTLIPIKYLLCKDANIHFTNRLEWDMKVLWKTISNGSSEMVSQLSIAITTLMFNRILLSLAGEAGVTAICIILYIQYVMIAVFLGFSTGITPVVAYNYGDKNNVQLHRLLRYALIFIMISSISVLIISYASNDWMSTTLVSGKNAQLLTYHGVQLFSLSYLFVGFNIFTSCWFTALNNGKVSAGLSFFKNLFFVIVCLLILPEWWGIDGVWLAIPIAEFISFILSMICLKYYQKDYQY